MNQVANEAVRKNSDMPAPAVAPNQAISFSASFISVRSWLLTGRPLRRPNRNRPLADVDTDARDVADARKALREDASESYGAMRSRLGLDG